MKISRRTFGAAGIAALAFGGYARAALAAGETYINQVEGYGRLVADPKGFLDLPQGFSYSVISSAGEAMADGFVVPDHFDGMGCIPLDHGKVALIRNHELTPGTGRQGPTANDPARESRLAALPVYGRDVNGAVLPGGTSTVIYDTAHGRTVDQFLSLVGTVANCAGGITPWGSWLTCEETALAAPSVEKSHGWIFEVPATQRGLVAPVPLKAMGRFRHEAAAVDPDTGIVYLTEDRDDSLFYRFIPKVPGKLAQGGALQALALVDGLADSRNWDGMAFAPGTTRAMRWIDMDNVESPDDDLRQRGHAAGALLFARGEGIHLGTNAAGKPEFFFTATSGGAGRYGQIFRYTPAGKDGGALQLFVESDDPRRMDYADNLAVAPWGHLIVCEDRTGNKINHLRGVTPDGRTYTLARLNAETELAGACFSPDGRILFVNAYSPGRTLAITGPWRSIAL